MRPVMPVILRYTPAQGRAPERACVQLPVRRYVVVFCLCCCAACDGVV